MSDELLYAIDLEDPSGEFEPASELLNALEVEFSSFFDRENGTVRHTVYAVTEEGAKENLEAKRLRLVRHKEDSGISLILLAFRKGANPGLQIDEAPLFHKDGTPTDYYKTVYHIR